jgi:hypothetical protein
MIAAGALVGRGLGLLLGFFLAGGDNNVSHDGVPLIKWGLGFQRRLATFESFYYS